MYTSNENKNLIKKAIECRKQSDLWHIDTYGPIWANVDDLAGSSGIFCRYCCNPIWVCECWTQENMGGNYPPSSFINPKKCCCNQTQLANVTNNGYTGKKTCCSCLIPWSQEQWMEIAELLEKRIHMMDLHVGFSDQRTRNGYMKIYGEQINCLHSEVSVLKNEVALLKKALADTLELLAQK